MITARSLRDGGPKLDSQPVQVKCLFCIWEFLYVSVFLFVYIFDFSLFVGYVVSQPVANVQILMIFYL